MQDIEQHMSSRSFVRESSLDEDLEDDWPAYDALLELAVVLFAATAQELQSVFLAQNGSVSYQ